MPIRAVVFDLFDTLVDMRGDLITMDSHRGSRIPASSRALHAAIVETRDVSFEAWNDAVMAGHQEFVKSHLSRDREVSTFERMGDALSRLGIRDDALAERLSAIHMGALREVVRFPSHHTQVLEELASRVKLGLCSNFSRSETALEVIEAGGFRPHLSAVVVSDANGWRKPHPNIFDATLAELGVERSEVLHVGDSLRADIGGAAPLGIRNAWITRRIPDRQAALEKHDGPDPDHEISDLAELPELIETLDPTGI